MHLTLTPAYGRDYKSRAAILADLDADKDFISQPSGQYINRTQLLEIGARNVNVRYKRNTMVAVFALRA